MPSGKSGSPSRTSLISLKRPFGSMALRSRIYPVTCWLRKGTMTLHPTSAWDIRESGAL